MSINLATYTFEGPYRAIASLRNSAGVYAILDNTDDGYSILDIGESAMVQNRIQYHDRISCWTAHANGTLFSAVLYTPLLGEHGRRVIEHKLRIAYRPACGDR